jgi:diguanylate cyclase (GGDEF)-like protein/PAS domain S-box-containing protein
MIVALIVLAVTAIAASGAAVAFGARDAALRRRLRAAQARTADAIEKKLNVLETVGDGIYIVDDALRITHANEEAERLLRVPAGALVGRMLDEVVDPLGSELVPEIRAARRTAAAVERTHAFPATETWVEVRVHAAASETLISLRDVSERTRAELRLRENEQRLRLVTQHVDAVLWTTDREGRFTTISGGALEELGLRADDLLARSSDSLVAGKVLQDVFGGTATRAESQHDERWLRHHVEPIADAKSNVVGAVGVSIDITELKRAQTLLFDAAHHDRLTGLPNRLSLEQRLEETIAAARADDRRFGVLFLDLDRFKTINDTLGHNAGDEVLREVANRIQGAIRGGDVVARPGGDEFIVLLPRIGQANEIQQVAQRVLRALAVPVIARGSQLYVTASIGAAVFPAHGDQAEALIAHADAAMYRAKGMGGNRYALFDESMETVAVDRLALEHDLRHAVDAGELELRFQPVVQLSTNQIVGCEALVRWRHPVRGLIMPERFIGIAEETGSIVAIDRWVLREACSMAARMRQSVPEFRVAINMSSRDLREPDLPDVVAAALEDYDLPARALTVEITETVALDDSVLPVLRRLYALGVNIALDDFGIGYSSLSYLKRLPISVLKIDRSFVRDIASNAYDQAIVASIVAIARALDFQVIAEGIEIDAQTERLRKLGCDVAQGYRFGKPQALPEFLELVGHRGGLRIVSAA